MMCNIFRKLLRVRMLVLPLPVILLGMATSVITGCGHSSGPETVRVTGVVKYHGTPLESGEILFNPVAMTQGRPARGTISEKGEFVVSTFQPGDGLMPGEYSIAVVSTVPGTEPLPKDKGTGVGGKSAIPLKYNSIKTSDLKETISKEDSRKHLVVELKD